MRHTILVILCVSFLLPAFCQVTTYAHTDHDAKRVAIWNAYSPKRLAADLTGRLSDEEQKVRAIYFWITQHIRYDAKRFRKGKWKKQSATATLRRRKGMCDDYANLFVEVCKHAGIKALRVEGYAKGFGYETDDIFFNTNHVWNLVRVNGEWRLIDLTFGSGYLAVKPFLKERLQPLYTFGKHPVTQSKVVFRRHRDDANFFEQPGKFAMTHLPAVPVFQLLAAPLSMEGFEKCDDVVTGCNISAGTANTRNPVLGEITHTQQGDSAFLFNCGSILYQAHQYSMEASAAVGLVNGSDSAQVNLFDCIQLLDSSNNMLPAARAAAKEETLFRLKKSFWRIRLARSTITGTSKVVVRLYETVQQALVNNPGKIQTLPEQNEVICETSDKYREVTLDNIQPLKKLAPEETLPYITYYNELIAEHLDTVRLRSRVIDSTYNGLKDSLILALSANQAGLARLTARVKDLASTATGMRYNHLDNLDPDLAFVLQSRQATLDSVSDLIQQRVLLLREMKYNERYMLSSMQEIKTRVSACVSLFKKDKRLGYEDRKQFERMIGGIINDLEKIRLKNNTLIQFLVAEKKWSKATEKECRLISGSLALEWIYEQHRKKFKQALVMQRRKQLFDEASALQEANIQAKTRANAVLRKKRQ